MKCLAWNLAGALALLVGSSSCAPSPEGSGEVCGNGTCEQHELQDQSCPEDCDEEVCGNDQCEAEELATQSCPADCGGEVCGNGNCETQESASQSCPEDCACTTRDEEFNQDPTCAGNLCCNGMACGQGPEQVYPWYYCVIQPGDVCYNAIDPPAFDVASWPGYCCGDRVCYNSAGGTAGTGTLTVRWEFPMEGTCGLNSQRLCCNQDAQCPLGYVCTAEVLQGECHCTTTNECALVCLVAGQSALGSALPCCDGLARNPATAICGLPAGQPCYANLDCASADCNGELQGRCE